MIPFAYQQPPSLDDACSQIDHDDSMAIAGGTTMVDLMKLNILKPTRVVHVREVLDDDVSEQDGKLVIGSACTMSGLADHKLVKDRLPAIRHSLILAASPQIRNMATIGGNLMQRTRSTYYRHTDMPLPKQSNNESGFGDDVDTSLMALMGNHGRLVGMYPGDFAVTVVAFDGQLELTGPRGKRSVAARDFYQTPRDTFHYTTKLKPNELITKLTLPITPAMNNSLYLKVRERSSYAFALASASVGLEISGDRIQAAHIGLGGIGSIPWHSGEAENALVGAAPSDAVFQYAAEAALADANPPAGLQYKVPLAKRTLVRALQILRDRILNNQGPLDDEQLWAMQHGRS